MYTARVTGPEPSAETSRVRAIAIAVVAALGFGLTLWQLDGHYPLRHWLVSAYLQIWLLCAGWTVACLSAGHAILRRIRGLSLPLREHLLFSFACGVLAFAAGIFLIGLLGGLGPVTFVLWPLAMAAAGLLPLARLGRRALRRIQQARRRPGLGRPSAAAYAIFFFGAVGVLALYLNILTPNNVAYDARWYHLGLAEGYAAGHTVARFPEGWFAGALPQLASYLYTWAFLIPGGGLFTRVELATHLELVIFLATLAGIPLLVRWLLGGVRAPLSWAALFLFPGILVYDSTLSGAADHVLAFWAVPIFLAAGRFWRSWTKPNAYLLAIVAAGAALTKFQAIYLLTPIALAFSVRTLLMLRRRRSAREVLASPLRAGALFALLTSVHWLKNLLWYGDPFYPLLNGILEIRPWNPDADPTTTLQSGGFKPVGTFAHRLYDSTQAMATFAFVSHDWFAFHRDWPVFGFLFTLFLPFLLLLKGTWRLRALAAAALVGVFVWYWTFHQDRYLQSLVPWMAAVVAALIWRLWHAGWVARLSMVPLVALQIAWGGDHYFFPTHAMLGQQPARVAMDMIADGFAGRFADRFQPPSNLVSAGKTLPRSARVLIHEQHLRLGIGAPAVTDARGTQGALSYRRARSPREVWRQLRGLGVTHVLWPSSPIGLENWGDEAVFYDLTTKYLAAPAHFDGVVMGALGGAPPPAAPYGPVALLGCQIARQVSLPDVDAAIGTAAPLPAEAELPAIARGADFILLESGCRARFQSIDLQPFRLATARKGWETWVRR
jgi:hypothetical protein